MKREFGLDQIKYDATSVVTVGTFDGVHVGHQAIIRYLVNRANNQNGTSVVVTFSPHPREIVHGEEVPLLTTIDERADALEALGVDRFIIIPFTLEFSRLAAEEFVEQVLVERIGIQEVVIGYDHAFGHDRRGDAELLEALGSRYGFSVDVIPPQVVEQHVVSSTQIREMIGRGQVSEAAQLLGRRYSLRGTVIKGDGRGAQIGFPTANLQIDHPRKVIPAVGVYAVQVALLQSERDGEESLHPGMMNIGYRPTFGKRDLSLEVHLLDFSGDLYGRELRVEFAERMRDERKFDSIEELVEQLSKDRARCMDLLSRPV